MGSTPNDYLLAVLADLLGGNEAVAEDANRGPSKETILDALDSLIRFASHQNTGCVCPESVLETHLHEIAARQATALSQWVLGLVASPQHRVAGALNGPPIA